MTSWHSYPSIFNFGHRAIQDLLTRPVNVEEKVDGSQFSFGAFQEDDGTGNGTSAIVVKCKSKGAMVYVDAPPAMFKSAVQTVLDLFAADKLHIGWTYRGEVLAKAKHNSLTYDRAPERNIIIFDVNTEEETYLSYEDKAAEAARLGLEVVPRLFSGMVTDISQFRAMLDTVSVLGGQKIEGIVAKPAAYDLFGVDHKVLMGKYVSEAFRELHIGEWRKENPTRGDVIDKLVEELSTPARFEKAVLHLREEGKISDSVKDIGAIIAEVKKDLAKECDDYVKTRLYRAFADTLFRRAAQSIPQWYKDRLLVQQFEQEEYVAALDSCTTEPEPIAEPVAEALDAYDSPNWKDSLDRRSSKHEPEVGQEPFPLD